MKNEDRVTEILSSKGDMETDTLEKIESSVSAFSEEQKNRIYDLVIQKKSRADTENEERTGDDEMIKDDNGSTESESIISIVPERRQNIMIRLFAVAACISLVFGSAVFLNGKTGEKDNRFDEVKNTTVWDTSTDPYETAVTSVSGDNAEISGISTLPVTVVEKVTEPVYISGITETGTEKAQSDLQTAAVTTAITENKTSEKITLTTEEKIDNSGFIEPPNSDIGDYMLSESLENQENSMLAEAGLNEEQINKFSNAMVFPKLAEYINYYYETPEFSDDTGVYRKTTCFYSSYNNYLRFLFTSDCTYNDTKASDYWCVKNIDDMLWISGSSPTIQRKTWESVNITESTASSLKFDIYAYDDGKDGDFNRHQVSEILRSELENGRITEDDIKNRKTEDIIINSLWHSNEKDVIDSCEIHEDGTYTIHYRFHEEMVKESDRPAYEVVRGSVGWKFSVFENPYWFVSAGKS
ncbi:MAG: hypothetical protein IJL67_08195 [Oscillospiraceae bacterium]|nr:hypothetical protein [Oscillospiraceae bacterium]